MKIHDISVPVSERLHTYAGDPGVRISHEMDFERGDLMTVSRLDMGAHTGTHVDAPLHFVPGGKGADQLDLQVLIGPALVVDLSQVEQVITAADLRAAKIPRGTERLLLKTRNAALWDEAGFQEGFVAMGREAAEYALELGLRLIGIDYLSVEPFATTDYAVHRTLLGAGVVLVEGLDLSAIAPGRYELACLPLKIAGADGAPARAVLIER